MDLEFQVTHTADVCLLSNYSEPSVTFKVKWRNFYYVLTLGLGPSSINLKVYDEECEESLSVLMLNSAQLFSHRL